MSIDWFTVIAQWVNFLILVFLLRKFLYGPIIRAMDAREARIKGELDSAAKTKADAEQTAADYHRRREEFQSERDGLLAKARDEAAASRRELEAEARKDIEEQRNRWRRSLADQQESFLRELRGKLAAGVVDVSRRALAELADAELEAEVARAFEKRLDDLPEDEWHALAAEAGADNADLTVRSVFGLPTEVRERLAKRIAKAMPKAPEPEFETAGGVVCGIELRAGGRKVAWSVDEYLDRLADQVGAQLVAGAREDAAAAKEAEAGAKDAPAAATPETKAEAPAKPAAAAPEKESDEKAAAEAAAKRKSKEPEAHEAG